MTTIMAGSGRKAGEYQADPGSKESWQEYESLLEQFRQELFPKEPCQGADIVL